MNTPEVSEVPKVPEVPEVPEYNFNTIETLIESIKKYKQGRKRQKIVDKETPKVYYNVDMENLSGCVEPLSQLNELIGMDSIKKNIIDQVLFYAQRLNTNEMMHTCLTGPPGVGKTTLGKILAELYCNLGFLSSNRFRLVSRTELIAGYLGQTAIKTLKVLNESKGGVLFIDEAYSLGTNGEETGTSYSKECLDTINKFLSENTSDFILIIAGYKEELDKSFFSANKGLRRRFPWVYDISGYSVENLKDIFVYQVENNGWGFEEVLTLNNYKELVTLLKNNENLFEYNGGDTLLLFDKSKICHSRRVFGKRRKYKKYLNITDIRLALELMKSTKNKKIKSDPPFGMYT
jgi:SpoVK/Ycf46/Vps4 family AAA+-type ATPase